VSCTKCGGEPVYFRRYSGERLCRRCFLKSIEDRVRAAISRYDMLRPDDRIAVAVSGGKDSLTLITILHKIEERFPKSEVIAVTVDEGISDYRVEGARLAAEVCSRLGVEHRVYSFRDIYGFTLDEILERARGRELQPCSYCGVLRRKALNLAAREVGATKLAVAHNLDDAAQSILMNLIRGNPMRLARLKPVSDLAHPKLVQRVKPLCTIPEREIALYAYLTGIPIMGRQCPYAPFSLRNEIRVFLNRLEFRHPGAKFSVFYALERIRPILDASTGPQKLVECKICGEPTTGEICRACEILTGITR